MAVRTQANYDIALKIKPDVILLAHGAALVNPEDGQYMLDHTGCHGVQLGSSIERMAIEVPLQERAAAFKAVHFPEGSPTEMALRIVFFGNSESVFSNRALRGAAGRGLRNRRRGGRAACAAHHRPTRGRRLSVPTSSRTPAHRGIPVVRAGQPEPAGVRRRRCADLRPDLFLAVGYTQPAES